jgi:HflK protein
MILSFLVEVVRQFAWAFARSAPYLLLGLLAAGALRAFIPDELLLRLLGGSRRRSVVLASLLGIPLPICSCGVVPVSVALRRKGAGRGPTMAFLVSTPETGVDSIALTLGLMGPVMAVFRPLVALVTSLVGGLLVRASDGDHGDAEGDLGEDDEASPACACEGEASACDDACEDGEPVEGGKLRSMLRYGFVDLLGEMAVWLLAGLALTAVVGAALPDGALEGGALGSGLTSMLLMVFVGLPIYMCASGSTPLGAALVAKGLNPGAALVFLLVGPTTNLATITLVRRFHGDRFVKIYLATVVSCALLGGVALNVLLGMTGWQVLGRVGTTEAVASPFEAFCALLLAALIVNALRRVGVRDRLRELRDSSVALALLMMRVRRWERPGRRIAAGTAALLIGAWLWSGVTVVRPGEVGIARRFGTAQSPPMGPGLHLTAPYPIARVDICRTDHIRLAELGFRLRGEYRVRDPEVASELDLITGDENLVDVTATAEYRVVDPHAFLYNVADPDALVRHSTIAAMNEVVVGRRIDHLLTRGREDLQERTREEAQARLDAYGVGVELVSVRLLDVHAPPQVHDAFREVASALEDATTTVNVAGGDRARLLAEARGEATRVRKGAQADATRLVLLADGEARAFAELAEVASKSPSTTRKRLYLETLQDVLAGRRKIIRPGSGQFDLWTLPGGGQDEGGGRRIQIPVLPERPGDPTSAEIELLEEP